MTEEEEKKYGDILGVDLDSTFKFTEPHPFYCSAAGRVKLLNQTMFFSD